MYVIFNPTKASFPMFSDNLRNGYVWLYSYILCVINNNASMAVGTLHGINKPLLRNSVRESGSRAVLSEGIEEPWKLRHLRRLRHEFTELTILDPTSSISVLFKYSVYCSLSLYLFLSTCHQE